MYAAKLVVPVLTVVVLVGTGSRVLSNPGTPLGGADIYKLYQELQLGMAVEAVATAVNGAALRTASRPVTSWLIWTPPVTRRPTTILRATFRDGRLDRLDYESFGTHYERLVKTRYSEVAIPQSELHRLWRDRWQLEETLEQCRAALGAYHRLVLGVQDRLSPEEREGWVRALELRRATESQINRPLP